LNKAFLVVYDKDNPKESQLMFEIPVEDSTDFNRYILDLEIERR
jgi:hypothetical protein